MLKYTNVYEDAHQRWLGTYKIPNVIKRDIFSFFIFYSILFCFFFSGEDRPPPDQVRTYVHSCSLTCFVCFVSWFFLFSGCMLCVLILLSCRKKKEKINWQLFVYKSGDPLHSFLCLSPQTLCFSLCTACSLRIYFLFFFLSLFSLVVT